MRNVKCKNFLEQVTLVSFCVSCAMCLCVVSCTSSGFSSRKIVLPELEVAYTMYGPEPGYKIDMTKPKVVTYFGRNGMVHLTGTLRETPDHKINSIISENPGIEFVFYLSGISHSDIDELLEILNRYDITYPIILDFDTVFAKNNNLVGMGAIGYFCDEENHIFKDGGGVIGTNMSKTYFDPGLINFKYALARKSMKFRKR